MLDVLRTLFAGASARSDEALMDHFAIELIEQKIREADAGLNAAKNTLASLIVRQRNETFHAERLALDIVDLEKRTTLALRDERIELAERAAVTIAQLENELAIRKNTLAQLNERIDRTRQSVSRASRQIVDLRQGMISARAADAERRALKRLNRTIGSSTAIREAESLIQRVTQMSDLLAESEVLAEIDADLDGSCVRDQLAEAGYGTRLKTTSQDVLARLRTAPTDITV